MRASGPVRVSLLAALASLLALACPAAEEPPAPACECPAGQRCTSNDGCLDDPGGNGGGGAGEPDECGASDDCLTAPFNLVPDVYWDGGDGEPVCTVRPGSCPQGGACTLPTECREPGDGRPGLFRCAADEDCASGRCVQYLGTGLCMRACEEDDDCPQVVRHTGYPGGFVCGDTEQRGVTIRSCLPLDEAHPERTLCGNDADCGLPGAGPEPGLGCRFVGVRGSPLDAVPVCDALPERPMETGTSCPWNVALDTSDPAFAASCDGGACNRICGRGGRSAADFCDLPSTFCTRPCRRDTDCPPRFVCGVGSAQERVGSWMAPSAGQLVGEHGRDVGYCRLSDGGCFDEVDCCPRPDGEGGCAGGWAPARQRCTLVTLQSGSATRLLTSCAEPDVNLAAPGSCCTAHEECDTLLCVPARPGGECAGSGVCSMPCAPVPDPDGVPGSGDERDRCAQADLPGSSYHLGSTCQPFLYSRSFVDDAGIARTLETTLSACQ